MIVAHLSDLHLGYRGLGRWDHGVNVRERDIARAFQSAVERVIEARPALVVITGDVFDRPDPSAQALVTLTRGIEALSTALPETPVHLVAGARDTPRRVGDSGALAALDAFPNVEAATSIPRTIHYEHLSLHVQLLPHRAVRAESQPLIEPDPRARFNVLAAYGQVRDDPGLANLEVDPQGWSYVALGSEHDMRAVAPRVSHAGALERVGPTPWREAGQDKGFLLVDLETGERRFERIPGRAVVALAPTRAPRAAEAALRYRFAEVVREIPGGIAGKIVRVRLRGPRPGDLAALAGVLPDLSSAALHLSVEVEDQGGAPSADMPLDLLEHARACLDADAPAGAAQLLAEVLADASGVEP